MRAAGGRIGIAPVAVLVLAGALAGCAGNRTPHLMNLRSGNTPDEFAILPNKPLQMPKDMSALPAPTPGGSNLADPTPAADAVAALGGKPSALHRQAIPAGDSALVAAASRHGVAPDIRQVLAAADLKFRRNHNGKLLDRLFGHTVYWRARGVATPSAPPQGVKPVQ
jgi:hypothetical protein